jgi:hypothetical protein
VSIAEAQRDPLTCTACGADVRVVPGCSYSALDREHFQELSDIVAQANLTPMEAHNHAADARRALASGDYSHQLEKATIRVLGLLPLVAAAGKNLAAQRRMLLRLQTIFEALSTARRRSAEYPAVPTPAAFRADKA